MVVFSLLFSTSVFLYYVKSALKVTGMQDGAIDMGPGLQEIVLLQNDCVIILTIFYSFGLVK